MAGAALPKGDPPQKRQPQYPDDPRAFDGQCPHAEYSANAPSQREITGRALPSGSLAATESIGPGSSEPGRPTGEGAYTLEIYEGSSFARARAPSAGSKTAHSGGGRRGPIREFSRASRRRFLETLARVRRSDLKAGQLVTLTFPAEYPDPRQRKQILERLTRHLRRAFPDCCGIWWLEYQERGAPHLHLVVLGVRWIDARWLGQVWRALIDRYLPEASAGPLMGPDIVRVRSVDKVLSYMTKYDPHIPASHRGRFWGTFGAYDRYVGDCQIVRIGPAEFAQMRRTTLRIREVRVRRLRNPKVRQRKIRWLRRWWRRLSSFSYIGPSVEQLARLARGDAGEEL